MGWEALWVGAIQGKRLCLSCLVALGIVVMMFLVCRVILNNNVIKVSCDFISGNP